jgi:imidazolonepropionase-like amidohydrolase
MLEAPATLERFAGKQTTEPWRLTRVAVSDPARAAIVVDSIAALGVDFIKVREAVDTATYTAIARAAQRRGIALAGHAPFELDVTRGARLGLATFEHASYPYPLDTVASVRRATLRAFREGGTAIVPTIVAWGTKLMHPDSLTTLIEDAANVRDARRRMITAEALREWVFEAAEMEALPAASLRGWCGFVNRTLSDLAVMHAAGVPILPGTDLGITGLFPGWSLHDELSALVRGGVMTPAEALHAATALAARHAGVGDEVGTIEPGMRADLLVLSADPTQVVAALRRLEAVVLNGTVIMAVLLAGLRGGFGLDVQPRLELYPGAIDAGCPPFSAREW